MAEAPPRPVLPQDPQSSRRPPKTARSTPPRTSPWPAGPRRTLPTSPTAGSRTASTSSTSGGVWGVGVGWGLVGRCWGASWPSQAWTFPAHVPRCSRLQSRVRILVDGSLWLQAAQPDDAGRYTCVPSNGLPRPPSASAYLTVLCKPDSRAPQSAAPHPHPSQAKRLLHNVPPCALRPSPGDGNASGDTPAHRHARGDPVPSSCQPPAALRQLDQGWAGPAAGQGTGVQAWGSSFFW